MPYVYIYIPHLHASEDKRPFDFLSQECLLIIAYEVLRGYLNTC